MKDKTAAVWIRDGVLVDRMALNAVMFGIACLNGIAKEQREQVSFTALISFAFEKSGISFEDKLAAWNQTGLAHNGARVPVQEEAARLYGELSATAGAQASYFPGVVELLRQLRMVGVQHYVTSAVNQEALDHWLLTTQGQVISGELESMLGSKPGFRKGRDHFEFIASKGYTKIIYIADAPIEISTAKSLAVEFPIFCIGFANQITPHCIINALEIVRTTATTILEIPALTPEQALSVDLPDRDQLAQLLRSAGCDALVDGTGANIVSSLSNCLQNN